MEDVGSVPLILRREIEALMAAPLIKGYIAAFGREAALETARGVIKDLATEAGGLLKAFTGGDTLAHFQQALPLFGQGGAMEYDVLEFGEKKAAINITRCRYAEMYKDHGLEEFGYLLSCGRDFDLLAGFNPNIEFTRTQTIMEGADYCDFRFKVRD